MIWGGNAAGILEVQTKDSGKLPLLANGWPWRSPAGREGIRLRANPSLRKAGKSTQTEFTSATGWPWLHAVIVRLEGPACARGRESLLSARGGGGGFLTGGRSVAWTAIGMVRCMNLYPWCPAAAGVGGALAGWAAAVLPLHFTLYFQSTEVAPRETTAHEELQK